MYHCTANIEISQQLVYMLFCRRFWPSLAEKIVLLYFTPSFSHLSDHKDFSPQKFSVEQFVWKFGPPKGSTSIPKNMSHLFKNSNSTFSQWNVCRQYIPHITGKFIWIKQLKVWHVSPLNRIIEVRRKLWRLFSLTSWLVSKIKFKLLHIMCTNLKLIYFWLPKLYVLFL